jgi:indole-3-glycerol phosphate synthase
MDGLNNLAETVASPSFWDSLTKAIPSTADATAKIIAAYKGTSPTTGLTAEQQMQLQLQQQQLQASRTSQYLLYGGIAVGAIALLMYLKKRKG